MILALSPNKHGYIHSAGRISGNSKDALSLIISLLPEQGNKNCVAILPIMYTGAG